jgi:hypothetical protein
MSGEIHFIVRSLTNIEPDPARDHDGTDGMEDESDENEYEASHARSQPAVLERTHGLLSARYQRRVTRSSSSCCFSSDGTCRSPAGGRGGERQGARAKRST